jgi:uncharacterized protein (DUF1697 family)
MTAFVALLRAVNVGGTGKLPMSELKPMCEALGFEGVRTYIASGNVVFTRRKSESAVKKALEARLEAYAGKAVGVMVRTAAEMQAVLKANPFPKAPGNRTVAIFLDAKPPGGYACRRQRTQGRRNRIGRARDLRPLRRRHGTIEAGDPCRQSRNRAQHEYDCDAGKDRG